MKDHCGFLSALNVGGEQEILNLYWNSTEMSQKKWWLYMYNNFTPLLLLLKPFSGGSGRKKKEYSYTLRALTHIYTTELSQAGKWMGDLGWNSHPHLVLGIVLKSFGPSQGDEGRDGGIEKEEGREEESTMPGDRAISFLLAAGYMFI